MNEEEIRIQQHYQGKENWLKWGPYLSERQWGTVREDYSSNSEPWGYSTHENSRSKAYRWGEDGLAGFCDDRQILCLSLALWNGKDPILKERLFGLNNFEGNHGEDVKELYYYLDNVPTHCYNKMLYKYPQREFPYDWLVNENARRTRMDPEFELIDTGIFKDDRYFDVFTTYAKNTPEDILVLYSVHNRAAEPATIHLLPQLFFRNTWSWNDEAAEPLMTYIGENTILLNCQELGDMFCCVEGHPQFLFTRNESNAQLLYGTGNKGEYYKDGINNFLVKGEPGAINLIQEGTKAAIWYQLEVPAGEKIELRLRLSNSQLPEPFAEFDAIMETRARETDQFYEAKHSANLSTGEKMIQRQAWAGLLWSKQFYYYNVNVWRNGDQGLPEPSAGHANGRNSHWKHFTAENIFSMPDKWEYPWFAAWDLGFHAIAFAPIDPDFAKQQLLLLLQSNFMHPNGQLPAYEWDFDDANPPVHALAAWKIYQFDKKQKGAPDLAFLEAVFQKLLLNFTWWVNRKDSNGNNIFEGGFLGLDNIGIFNRSEPVPGGGVLEQADGTSWMAMYALNMVKIALELALTNPVYEAMAIKFSEHFLFIAGSLTNMGEDSAGLWDDEDGFYYDLLKMTDNGFVRLKARSVVGLIPMFATIIFDESTWKALPGFKDHMEKFSRQRPDLAALVSYWKDRKGSNDQHLFSLLRGHRLKMLLRRMLDEAEFLSPYGVRSLSRIYGEHPYELKLDGTEYSIRYTAAESDTGIYGGNSNWRGPIWFPLNFLIIESLYNLHEYYSDDFRVEYPTRSGNYFSLAEIAASLANRLKSIFTRDGEGNRPVFDGVDKFNTDPNFCNYILFYEYFDGDTGKGLGAAHQTGWTSLVTAIDCLRTTHNSV